MPSNPRRGAPGPTDEPVRRRARTELSIVAEDPWPSLHHSRYRATMADGTVENEICPVYVLRAADLRLDPDPAEVSGDVWTTPDDLTARVTTDPDANSPWPRLQLPQLLAEGMLDGHL